MMTVETKQNSLKNQDGLDAFDIEAARCGQAIHTLIKMRPANIQNRKKMNKVNINNFLE